MHWCAQLFRAGVQRKLVKETTGHSSDAIDKYQITSHEQRQIMSEVIAGKHIDQVKEVEMAQNNSKLEIEEAKVGTKCEACKGCDQKVSKIDETNVGEVVNELVKHHKKEGKTR